MATIGLSATGLDGRPGLTSWAIAPAFAIVAVAVTMTGEVSGSWTFEFNYVGNGLWMSLAGGLIATAASVAAQIVPRDVEPVAYEEQRAA